MNLRNQFKTLAQANEELFKKALQADFENLWSFVSICNDRVNACLDGAHKKQTLLILMLRNTISDVLCCLDALERGHQQTVLNNLRMIFEGYCLVFHLHDDKTSTVFGKFQAGKHKVQDSVDYYAKKNYEGYQNFGRLYGMLSEISHQSQIERIARQIILRADGKYIIDHIKQIDPNYFKDHINALLIIIFLVRATAELSEEIVIHLIEPYFWQKTEGGFQKKIIKEDEFIQRFCTRASAILNS